MEVKIWGGNNKYWVEIEHSNYTNLFTDDEIAKYINVNITEYINIGKTFNGYIKDGLLFFHNKKDAKKFSNKLTSYIIANKLRGNKLC